MKYELDLLNFNNSGYSWMNRKKVEEFGDFEEVNIIKIYFMTFFLIKKFKFKKFMGFMG